MATSLPRSTPTEQDVDPAAVLAFLDAVQARPDVELHSLMVVRHGHVVAEGWWSPYTPERRHLLYSLSKSVTAAAVGFAQAEDLLDLDDPVIAHFPEIDPQGLDPRSRATTLRHVAAMASGHTRDVVHEAWSLDPQEPVRGFLLVPPDREPGTVFAYNQPCTYSLAAVVQRAAGLPLTQYLRPRLFDPLGIGDVGWQAFPPGRELGYTGLHARTEDVAKLGLLHLQRGRWGEQQLLPQDWVDQATSKQVDNPDEPSPDWRQGYGFQFWRSRHGYRGDGAYGQFCVVLPEHDTVVVTTGATESMQAVLDDLWAVLLPGLGRSGSDAAAQDELERRLAGLHLPPCPGGGSVDPAGWPAGEHVVSRDGAAGEAPTALLAVGVQAHGDRLRVTLHEAGNSLALEVGLGEWVVGEPVDALGGTVPVAGSGGTVPSAAAGGGTAAAFRVEVLFLETPHRLDLLLTPADRTAVARWRHRPLFDDRIEHLHCP